MEQNFVEIGNITFGQESNKKINEVLGLHYANYFDIKEIADIKYNRLKGIDIKKFVGKERTFIMIKPDGIQRSLIG